MNPRFPRPGLNREAVAPSRRFVTQPLALRLLSVVCIAWASASASHACTIPVFRFALDRWEADPFRLVIPSSWGTQPEMIRLLVPLRGNSDANVKIQETSDTAITEAKLLFPRDDASVWSGKLDATTLSMLLDSPARQDLLKRILTGDSAIWVVCTKDADKAEADRIEKRLRYLEQVAALPPQDPSDPDSQLGPGPPLKLKFSVLRLSLDDPKERLFASMIAGPKQQEFIAKGTPFAGPVFAKGRVLGSWALSELDDTAIEDATLFLIGRCSCRIKNENPGWDVILKTEWEHALAKAGDAAESSHANGSETIPATAKAQENEAIPDAVKTSVPETQNLEARLNSVETYVATASPPPSPSASTAVYFTLSGIPLAAVGVAGVAVIAALMLWFKH